MSVNVQHLLVEQFLGWLRREITSTDVLDNWTEITLPLLDSRRDYVQVYVRATGDGFEFTDDGQTFSDLQASGIALTQPRLEVIDDALERYGTMRGENDSLVLKAPFEAAPIAFAEFVQAILAVDVVRAMSRPSAINLFFEVVAEWLDSFDIEYTRKPKLRGRTNFEHEFDFLLPLANDSGERLIKTVNRPTRENIKSYLFAFTDVRELNPDITPYVILNEDHQEASVEDLEALDRYNVTTIRWEHRSSAIRALGIA